MVAREIKDGHVGEKHETMSGLMGVKPRQVQGVLKAKQA